MDRPAAEVETTALTVPVSLRAQSVELTVAPVFVEAGLRAAPHSLLALEERLRSARLPAGQDRARFVASRALLRTTVGRLVGIAAEEVLVVDGPGRTWIDGPGGALEVGMASGGSAVAVALSRSGPVGIAIEPVGLLAPTAISQALTLRERAAAMRLPEPLRSSSVLRSWTLKVAYANLVAGGAGLDLSTLEVASIRDRARLELRSFLVSAGSERFRIGLAARSPRPPFRVSLTVEPWGWTTPYRLPALPAAPAYPQLESGVVA